jgi:hypothetical protein
MYTLLKRLNIDMIKEIYYYNNYSQLDLEWFKFNHKEKYVETLNELRYYFLHPKLKKMWAAHINESIIEELDETINGEY